MAKLILAIATATSAFIATNIDDVLVLMLFFMQVRSGYRSWQIVLGQYLGFSAIVVASLPGFLGGQVLQRPWIGLLGLVPLTLGMIALIRREEFDLEAQTITYAPETLKHPVYRAMTRLFNPQSLSVAAVTFANGGDNIGVYLSLFASSNFKHLLVTLGVFYLWVGIWCYLGYYLTRHQAITEALIRYSHVLIPMVFISLGLFILIENQTYTLFL